MGKEILCNPLARHEQQPCCLHLHYLTTFYTLFIFATAPFVYKNRCIMYNIMLEYSVLKHKSITD